MCRAWHGKRKRIKINVEFYQLVSDNKSQQSVQGRIRDFMTKEKELITQRELAHTLGVCAATIRRWEDCPRVAISKGRHRFNLAAVRAWLELRAAGKGVQA